MEQCVARCGIAFGARQHWMRVFQEKGAEPARGKIILRIGRHRIARCYEFGLADAVQPRGPILEFDLQFAEDVHHGKLLCPYPARPLGHKIQPPKFRGQPRNDEAALLKGSLPENYQARALQNQNVPL